MKTCLLNQATLSRGALIAIIASAHVWGPSNSMFASGQSEADVAVDEFIVKYQALRQQRRQGMLSDEDWDRDYTRLMESEADRVKPLVPEAFKVIGGFLQHRSERDRRIEELLKESHATVQEAMELQSLVEERSKERKVPRCGLAFLTGYLGRSNPKGAVDVLLSSVPAPERSEDMCIMRALMTMGPSAYESILSRISSEADTGRLYVAVMALTAQASKTDFPVEAGIGPQEDWDHSFPKTRRRLRALAEKWKTWWSANETKYAWNAETSLLELK